MKTVDVVRRCVRYLCCLFLRVRVYRVYGAKRLVKPEISGMTRVVGSLRGHLSLISSSPTMAAPLFHPVAFIFIAVSPDQAGSLSFCNSPFLSPDTIRTFVSSTLLRTLGSLDVVCCKEIFEIADESFLTYILCSFEGVTIHLIKYVLQ